MNAFLGAVLYLAGSWQIATWFWRAVDRKRRAAPARHHAELAEHAVKTADIALQALTNITELLDGDCDLTRVALYNPRETVASIRLELEAAARDLSAHDREAHS